MADWASDPVLGVRHLPTAVAYYTDVLGFSCPDGIFVPDADEGGVYAIVERNNARIHLQIRRREINASRESIEGDAYIYVDDAKALFAELEQQDGIRIHRRPVDSSYGLTDFVIEDVDGNRITFGAETAG